MHIQSPRYACKQCPYDFCQGTAPWAVVLFRLEGRSLVGRTDSPSRHHHYLQHQTNFFRLHSLPDLQLGQLLPVVSNKHFTPPETARSRATAPSRTKPAPEQRPQTSRAPRAKSPQASRRPTTTTHNLVYFFFDPSLLSAVRQTSSLNYHI